MNFYTAKCFTKVEEYDELFDGYLLKTVRFVKKVGMLTPPFLLKALQNNPYFLKSLLSTVLLANSKI